MLLRKWKILLFATLAGLAGLVVFAPALEEPARSPPLVFSARTSTSVDSTAAVGAAGKDVGRFRIPSEFPERDTLGEAKTELFGLQSWQLPKGPVAVSAPRAPTPPPMTYRFAGRLLQDGKLQLFVSKGDKPVSVKVGDTLEGGYVVEAISAEAIALIYPPLGHRANIVIPPVMSAAGAVSSSSTAPPPTGPGTLPAQAVINPPSLSTQTQRDISTAGNPSAGSR